jgi:hypothetical protein
MNNLYWVTARNQPKMVGRLTLHQRGCVSRLDGLVAAKFAVHAETIVFTATGGGWRSV